MLNFLRLVCYCENVCLNSQISVIIRTLIFCKDLKMDNNVGSEVYGKGKDFARPVLVVKVFFNGTFLGVPLTSKAKNKTGRLYHKFIDSKNRLQVALLGQIRIFDIKRVANYISKIEKSDFEKIRAKIQKEIV